MRAFGKAVLILAKRPSILLIAALMAVLYGAVDYINPIIPILSGFAEIDNSGLQNNIVSFLQVVLKPDILPLAAAAAVVFSVISALLSGIFFSGMFNIVNNVLSGKKKAKGEFAEGLKKYFVKVFLIVFLTLMGLCILVFLLMVASVPAVVITRTVEAGRPELGPASLFVVFLTAVVIFFGFMFFRSYTLFVLPASINGKKPFNTARKFADRNFWRTVMMFIVLDLLFVLFYFLKSRIDGAWGVFLFQTAYLTLFISFYATCLFSFYKTYSSMPR